MTEYYNNKTSIKNGQEVNSENRSSSNPLLAKNAGSEKVLNGYAKSIQRKDYDKDVIEIIEIVRILNNLAPIRMPEYNFNLDEINGESYYRPDGTLLLIREYDSDVIRDYYATTQNDNTEYTVGRILEHDKISGRLKTKIEPISRKGSRLKTNITIFDFKVNNKYTIIQLADGGLVNNISEFTGKGKSFRTLFRNLETLKPARYLEGKDSKENGFEMNDCLFNQEGQIVRIKRYSNKKEINIDYTKDVKNVIVKTDT